VKFVFATADVPFKVNSRRLRKARRNMAKKTSKEIIIRIHRGLVEVVSKPKNLRVLLRDYDIANELTNEKDQDKYEFQEDDIGQYEETEI